MENNWCGKMDLIRRKRFLKKEINGHKLATLILPSFISIPHKLVQVLLHIFENKVEGVILSDHLLQLHHVLMAQFFETLKTKNN